jgi:hypothetical protein
MDNQNKQFADFLFACKFSPLVAATFEHQVLVSKLLFCHTVRAPYISCGGVWRCLAATTGLTADDGTAAEASAAAVSSYLASARVVTS